MFCSFNKTAADESVTFAGSVKYFEMAGAECAVSPTLEEALQKEREDVLSDLNDQIEFIINHPDQQETSYPIPLHDLMQNKIYRITLDATA